MEETGEGTSTPTLYAPRGERGPTLSVPRSTLASGVMPPPSAYPTGSSGRLATPEMVQLEQTVARQASRIATDG